MYNDLFLFIKVAQIGSFTKAARELELYQSTISRRISTLEEELGTKLIVRTSNHFELTKDGQQLLEQLKEQESIIQRKIFEALENQETIFGEIRVMLPQVLSLHTITPRVPEFMANYPRLKIRLHYQNHEINIQKDSYDLAIILGLPEQSAQKVKLIYRAKLTLFCTPQYMEKYGLLDNIHDLGQHNIIATMRDHGEIINRATFKHKITNELTSITLESHLACNSYFHDLVLVDSGEYIGTTYDPTIEKYFKSGKYIQVLSNYTSEEFDFYLIKRVEDDVRINLLASFIEKCFQGFNQ